MIIEGNPKLGLQKHQQDAYEAVQNAYTKGNKASVVIPTGCGKSFIALQLMADNKDKRILFMAPTNAIKNQMYNYIAKYIVGIEQTREKTARMIADEYFPHLKIMLYPSLLRVNDEQMEKLNADIIVMDELHRTGADKWNEKINTLLKKNPNANILGLTATPDRMDDKNVIDDLFEGNINYELTLIDALREDIVKSPTYVKCDYALGEHLEGIRIAILNCKDEQTRKELQEKYDKMRKIVEQADGIPELFSKNIKKKNGKYIIFCKDKEHMDELMDKAKEWFASIDIEPELFSVFSGVGYTEKDNKKTIKNFENSKSEHIKLLFSIEMLNEGLHVEDISGVIMARPTDSRIIYLQQLGRALSSDTSREKTIVFDLVNNYLKNNLDAEINKRRKVDTIDINGGHTDIGGEDGATDIEDIDIFRIQGETQEFLELLNEVYAIIDRSDFLNNARAIKKWIDESGDTRMPNSKSTDIEERRLGTALSNLRRHLIKPYLEIQNEEEREQFRNEHPEIDEVLKIINEIDANNIHPYIRNINLIKEWIDKSGDTKLPQAKSNDEEERKLGIAWGTLNHNLIKPYLELKTRDEQEQFRGEHPEIDEVLEIVNEIRANNIHPYIRNARAIKEWIEQSGDTKPPSNKSNDEEERKLATSLYSMRNRLIKPYLGLQTEEEKEQFRSKRPEIDEILEIVNEIDSNNLQPYMRNIRLIKEWIDKSGDTKTPSSSSKNEYEKKLGMSLVRIRCYLIKPYLEIQTEEEREQFRDEHPEIDEVLEIINEIDGNNVSTYLRNAKKIKKWIDDSGDIKPPSRNSNDEEERYLGQALDRIRKKLIEPYIKLQTEEEKKQYIKQYPELYDVMDIISEIDSKYVSRSKKQQELADLIRQDLEKRRTLQEARKLEQDYEQQLSKKGTKDIQKQGVDFNE